MRNNKGYTLVELLVTLAVFAIIMAEVGSMMMNSSRLYRNGTYEVELQTEAQQIVQQMEELLIDVNHSLSAEGISSNLITISNNDAIYKFELDMDHSELGYGTLYFNKESLDGGSDVTHIPMAEYVQSISLDMAAYAYDVVTLNVSMNNGKYGYQASQDIFLRNRVGSGGGGNYGDSSSYDFDVDILRLRNYNLNDYLDDSSTVTYEFKWSDTNDGDPSNSYKLDSDGSIRVGDAKRYGRDELGPYIIEAVEVGDSTNTHTIRVSTKPPMVGVNGSALFMTHSDRLSGSYLNNTPIPVQGVAVEAAEITITLRYQLNPSSSVPDAIYTHTMLDSELESPVVNNSGEMKYNNNGDYLVQIQNFNFVKEPISNCFQVRNTLISGGGSAVQQYYNYIRDLNRTIYFEIEFDWGHNLKENCIAHMYVVPANDYERMPEGSGSVYERFWNLVGLD